MIPFNDFLRLLNDASNFPDVEQFIAELGGSVPIDDADEVIRLLNIIWDMGSGGLTIDSIFQTCGRSMRNFAMTYHLPYNTVQNWHLGVTCPPAWQLPFLAYAAASDYFLARL